ncbi:MAG: aminoacyl-tRNA hydrolase [Candidatus Nanosyncoccaceae bacterium]
MKLIVGLGNPGREYQKTRHNLGFMLIDELAKKLDVKWQTKPKWQAEIAEANIDGKKVILVKPTSFYNLTGNVVRRIGDFYKINYIEDLLVIHDDLALDFGTIRVRKKGSDGGNNGIKSIIAHLGENFWRIRIGTKTLLSEQINKADYVLSRLPFKERRKMKTVSVEINQLINQFVYKQLTETSASVLKLNK